MKKLRRRRSESEDVREKVYATGHLSDRSYERVRIGILHTSSVKSALLMQHVSVQIYFKSSLLAFSLQNRKFEMFSLALARSISQTV